MGILTSEIPAMLKPKWYHMGMSTSENCMHSNENLPTTGLPTAGDTTHWGASAWLLGAALMVMLIAALEENPLVVAHSKETTYCRV